MPNNKGFIKIVILVLIIIASLSLIYYFYSDLILKYLEPSNSDTVVYIRDEKLYKFNFLNFEEIQLSKNYEFNKEDKIYINITRNRVALISNASKDIDQDSNKNIIFYNLNTLEEKILVSNIKISNLKDFSIEISPNGKKIAYAFNEEEKSKVTIIDDNNQVIDEIQNPNNSVLRVVKWSPKGDKLLYRILDREDGKPVYDKKSKLFIYNTWWKKSSELNPSDETSQNTLLFDNKDDNSTLNTYIWEDEDTIQIIKQNINRDNPEMKTNIFKYSISKDKAIQVSSDKLSFVDGGKSNYNGFDYDTVWYLSKDSDRNQEYYYFKDYKYILLLDSQEFSQNSDNTNRQTKLKIYNTETKEYKDIMNFKGYEKYQIAGSNGQIFGQMQYWWKYKAYVYGFYWTSDHKSLIFRIDIDCARRQCKGDQSDLTQEEKDLQGVYKVNVDGTNLEKIKKEIPDNWFPEFWY